MKSFSIHPGVCSCTSCVYRSRSKEPKVQQIIQGGTEIDKLYYGKFLPLRERKLLEKLIRTRDVYDDVRTQLLSSASSDQTSLEYKRKRRDDASTDKSSAILKMVDLVDRGQMGSANTSKLSSCCSCCSCETLRKIRKRMEKDNHKHSRVHRHIVTCEDIAKYCDEAEERGRKRRNKLSTKISSKIAVAHLKMKKNLSEPCACTLSLTSMATRSSKALKKIRSKNNTDRKVVTIDQETEIAKLPKKLRNKGKNIQSSTTKDSETEVRSLKAFKIKKDSILLFKEKLLKKRTYEDNQDVECEPGTCNTYECIPEECLIKIKAKGVGDKRKRKYHTRHSETKRDRSHISTSSRTKKVKVRDSRVQDGPSTKSSHSMTTILKTKAMPSFSKSKIKRKMPISLKQRQQFDKGTGKQDKAHKTTKSTTSMTSIPKSKAKAQLAKKEDKVAPTVKPKAKLPGVTKDKRLEEKGIRVQVTPQPNLATCECKSSTKSTSSLTSAPKQKASKSRSKRIKSYEFASPPTLYKRGRQKPRRESYQNVEEADLEEPIEHVKDKREKRMKPTHGRIKQRRKHKHSNTQFTGTLPKASQESYLREFASQANDLPFPRECEPLMCIPYECDPEKCTEILLSRSKSRGKPAMTSMDRLRRKSVGSAAFSQKTSQKTSSRSRTKSKHKQSKSAENFIRKPKYASKEPPPQNVEKCFCPDSQAAKITSSFNFDFESYKDTYPGVKDDEKKELVSGHQTKIKQKEHRRKHKDHGTGYISSRQNISSQSRSSQSFKNIQVGHRLKRCFCTLKLLPNKNQKLKNAVSKRTMTSFHNKKLDMGPRKKRTQTKPSGIAYVVPPATSTQPSLLPYECEPIFCTPSECNPYECAERIKQRNRRPARHVSKKTTTTVTPKKSKLASTSQSVSKSTSRPIHSCDCHSQSFGDKSERHENRNIKHKGRRSPSSNVERTFSGDKLERQAVRIGSNFNFNIDFSKTIINDQEYADTLNQPIKRERRHLQEKGIKVYKPHVRHVTSETNKYVKQTKQTHTEPFLQRCLCTLKLLKKNKKKVETISPWPNRNEYVMHMQKKSVTTNRAEIRYNPERSELLPYEWEPGLCIPKECDPYNCENLIKFRHMILQNNDSNIFPGDLGFRSKFSKTWRTVTSKSQNTPSFTKECLQKVKKRNQDYNEINIMPSLSKQRVMRLESKLSLKMSRYKSKDNFMTTEDKRIHENKHIHNKDKLNHTTIDAEAKCKEKGNYVFSVIKRCFSSFKFQKKRNQAGLENSNVISESKKTSYPLPNSQISEYKCTCTRLSKLPYGLSSYECAPNFCIPGMRVPYECYEESKQREIKGLHDHYVSTGRRERKSVISVTTSDFSSSKMARSTKSRLLKHKTKKDRKVTDKQRNIKATRSFSSSRQATRKESNFSFNKVVSKYRFVPTNRDTTIKNRVEKYKIVSEISTISRMLDKDTKTKRVALKHDLSKENEIRKEVKASNVGFLLKRCFCILGFQNQNKSKPEFRWHKPITTQFVQVEQNRHDITKSGCQVPNKSSYGEDPLKLKVPEGDHLFRENLIANQSAEHLPNSRSFSRQTHVRSRIEFNFDKMRCLLNTQKINPFYRSFYALNVKVPKSKNISLNKYRALDDNDRRPGESAKPITFGSNLSIEADVYRDIYPYKSSRRQALRLGSDVRLNFDFVKEPPSRRRTGPIPYHDRKEAGRSNSRPADLKAYGETQSKVTGISHVIQRCFCASKLKNAIKSDINQNRDVNRTVKGVGTDNPRYKPTTRFSLTKEKRERSLKSKSVQYKDYSQQQRKKSHRSTDRNNVTFCTNVNCVEFYNDRTQKQTKLNRVHGRGEGDVGKQKGPIAEKKTVIDKRLSALKITEKPESEKRDKKKRHNKFMDKCYCTLKYLKGQNKGKHLTPKQSMEIIGKQKKKYKQLDEAEREMETIMPYSKKKFKKLDSQSKLAQGTNQNTKQNQQGVCDYCKQCQPIESDSKKKIKILDGLLKLVQGTIQNTKQLGKGSLNTCFCPKHSNSFSYLYYEDAHLKGLCPVCKAIATENFSKTKNKLPCTCNGQDLGKKKSDGKREKGGKGKPKTPVVDNTPLFEMTVNKTNMKILNKDAVLKNLGSSGKESKAMKKARAAIKKGNVDAPVMEMIIDRGNASILNSDQIIKQINNPKTMKKGESIKAEKKTKAQEQAGKKTKSPKQAGKKTKALEQTTESLSTSQIKKSVKKERGAAAKSHGNKCKCCICRGFKKGKIPPGAKFSMQTHKLRPCVCGSVICKKDWDRIYHEQRSLAAVKLKKCVCGSNICEEESSKMPELLLEGARLAEREKEMAKRAVIKEKLYQKARKKRAKQQKKAFIKQKKRRKKQDKRAMKSVKKSQHEGDISLMAESLIDLGTFGSKAFCDIARTMFRAVRYPRDAYSDVQEAIKDPSGAVKALQERAEGMGLNTTLSRIKQRMLRMPTANQAVTALESYPATNYLIHMADKDPKKRMKKFKTKRTREPLDFQCSVYMASMRKRPCLRIYYMCPWFYPHCMSLLNLWKQLTDILLFLLAVAVWSPCILCMELCRGFMCCGMCQG